MAVGDARLFGKFSSLSREQEESITAYADKECRGICHANFPR